MGGSLLRWRSVAPRPRVPGCMRPSNLNRVLSVRLVKLSKGERMQVLMLTHALNQSLYKYIPGRRRDRIREQWARGSGVTGRWVRVTQYRVRHAG